MNRSLTLAAFAAAVLGAGLPAAAADVGVSVQISQPGIYGRIDIGRFPQPQVVVQQPVLVMPPYVRPLQPVYMWVPPGHRKDWKKHCGAYGACGVPVYFVTDEWYAERVQPYSKGGGQGGGQGQGKGKGNNQGNNQGKGKGND